jgi:tetratricopeptide (TPR) repeat protein
MAEAERAIALDPNYAGAHGLLGDILLFVGRPQEATKVYEKAMRLNPYYPGFYTNGLAAAYLLMQQYEEAISLLKQAVSRSPNLLQAHWNLAVAYSELGWEAGAHEAAEILRLSPNFSVEELRQSPPVKDPDIIEHFIAALRKAGLK